MADDDLVNLDDTKRHLNIKTTANDAELALFISAATPLIEDEIGPVAVRQVTESPAGRSLRYAPVNALTVTVAGVAYTAFTANLAAGLVYGLPSGAVVTYTVGRSPVPAAVRLATLVVIEHLWRSSQNAGPSGRPQPGGGYDDGLPPTTGLPFAMPRGALQLLQPYRRAGSVG